MNEDLLQTYLTRLENGETLEAVLATVSAEDTALVRLAANLRALPYPARAEAAVTAQRARLLTTAQKGNSMSQKSKSPSPWLWGGLAFAGAGTFAFLCLFATLAAGALWFWNNQNQTVANPQPSPVIRPQTSTQAVPNAKTALVRAARGVVQVQTASGVWVAAQAGDTVSAGQSVRTLAYSSATLAFYDGSVARLGPNTELALTALDAQKSGARIVQLTQIVGDSDHTVAKSTNPDSVYEVATPSGTGRATGTAFHVSVSALTHLGRIDVTEGAVVVTHLDITVIVAAGQTTVLNISLPPTPPVFHYSGEGQVQALGEGWIIAGQTMYVTAATLIEGDPHVGDWVSFQGHLQADGTRIADRITLLHRGIGNDFTFIGTVEVISATAWIISGHSIGVDAATVMEPALAVGAQVEVTGHLTEAGAFYAVEIRAFAAGSEAPFEFVGVVESIGAEAWVVSGISVTVNVSTTLEAGIVVSAVVQVTGVILEDGTWQATAIALMTESGTFDFVGIVIRTAPWNVSGVPFEVDEATAIDEGIVTGNRVRVQGTVQADGTWLAERITQLDEGKRHAIQFTARVESMEPWVIGGVSVTVDSKTKFSGELEVGDLVHVKANLLPDGTVIAKKITLVSAETGCITSTAVVTSIAGNLITLLDGQTISLTSSITLTGELQINALIAIETCAGADDDSQIIISITVLALLEELPPTPEVEVSPTPFATPGAGGEGESTTICHIPGGNMAKAKTMTVGAGAVQAHLNHGDLMGPCP